MNPSTNETGGGLQPAAPIEQPAVPGELGNAAEVAPAVPEQAPATGQRAPAEPQFVVPPVPPISLPLPPIQAQNAAQDDVSVTTDNTGPDIVEDGDLIEKEWVVKAKQIVERNRDDPYKQSEELTVFKADYMKKRYDKSIKLS